MVLWTLRRMQIDRVLPGTLQSQTLRPETLDPMFTRKPSTLTLKPSDPLNPQPSNIPYTVLKLHEAVQTTL